MWDSLKVEVSSSKDISIFLKFRETFDALNSEDKSSFTFAPPTDNPFLAEQRQLICNLLSNFKGENSLIRADYRELLDLVLMYLSSSVPDNYTMQKPGATHKARWMGKLLYALKIVILEKAIAKISPKPYSRHQIEKIKRFTNFLVHIYVPWWFTCSTSATAPSNDLLFINHFIMYQEIDKVVGQSALTAFKRHLWYLSSDMVPLVLFDANLQNEQKQNVADAIKQYPLRDTYQTRFGNGFGKPKFPSVDQNTKLELLIDQDSWQFFNLLQIDSAFLNAPVATFDTCESYLNGKKIVDSLKVCNDSAERGVKLASDFLKSAKKEQRYQQVLQVVENDRKSCINQRKKQDNKGWYLVL